MKKKVDKKKIKIIKNKRFFNSIIIGLSILIFLSIFSIFLIKTSCKNEDIIKDDSKTLSSLNPGYYAPQPIVKEKTCEELLGCNICQKCIRQSGSSSNFICGADTTKNNMGCPLFFNNQIIKYGICSNGVCQVNNIADCINDITSDICKPRAISPVKIPDRMPQGMY
jgi:hypothetical protein